MDPNEFRGQLLAWLWIVTAFVVIALTIPLILNVDIADKGDHMYHEDFLAGIHTFAINIYDYDGRECLLMHLWTDDGYRWTDKECD